VVVRQQHRRAEQEPARRGGDEGQALQGVGDRQVRRELERTHPRTRVEGDVLGQVERLEAEVVGVLGHGPQCDGVGAPKAVL
jgi:hypothetical protein